MQVINELKGIGATAVGISGATVSWLETTNLIVSIVAGILAAVASAFAIYYYIKKVASGDDE